LRVASTWSGTTEKWYTQQQMVVSYLPADYFRCVTAQYKLLDNATLFGYNIQVVNHAENAEGKALGPLTTLCAKVVDKSAGKSEVAPCFLPTFLAGKYWVVTFDKEEDWALVSGGPPTVKGEDGCRTGAGVNDSGLWIFTRARARNEALLAKVRSIAKSKGYDVTVLKDVDHTNCEEAPSAILV